MPHTFVESEHPRGQPDNAGKFVESEGGGSPGKLQPKPERQSALHALAAKGKEALAKGGAFKKQFGDRFNRLPKPVRYPVIAFAAATSAIYKAGNAAVESVAKERGLSEEQTKRIVRITTTANIALSGTPSAAIFTALGLPGAATAVGSVLPLGSLAYLTYSTGRNPLASLKAARQGVRAVMAKVKKTRTSTEGKSMMINIKSWSLKDVDFNEDEVDRDWHGRFAPKGEGESGDGRLREAGENPLPTESAESTSHARQLYARELAGVAKQRQIRELRQEIRDLPKVTDAAGSSGKYSRGKMRFRERNYVDHAAIQARQEKVDAIAKQIWDTKVGANAPKVRQQAKAIQSTISSLALPEGTDYYSRARFSFESGQVDMVKADLAVIFRDDLFRTKRDGIDRQPSVAAFKQNLIEQAERVRETVLANKPGQEKVLGILRNLWRQASSIERLLPADVAASQGEGKGLVFSREWMEHDFDDFDVDFDDDDDGDFDDDDLDDFDE